MTTLWAIGIDIGGTNTKIALVNNLGEVHDNEVFATKDMGPFSQYYDHLKSIINKFIKIKPVIGIGVGAPNANFHSGIIENPVNLDWGNVPLKRYLEEDFKIKVRLDNDANVAAIGESIFGATIGVQDFILVTLGTGVGTGIFVEGRLLRGKNGKAGEGGHLVVEANGRHCGCGGYGHLEAYASKSGIEKTAFEIFSVNKTTEEIAQLFLQDDARAKDVIHRTAFYLGFGLSQICALLNPQVIAIGGGVMNIDPELPQKIQRVLDLYSFRGIRGETKVIHSVGCREKGAVLGAGALVFSE
jgi:glucokinase